MKLNKIFLPLIAVASMFGYACTEEVEYTPAEPAPVTDYYFPTVQNYHNDLVDGDTYVTVNIARANSSKAETLNFTVDITPAGNFTYPTSVEFPEGVGTVTFKIEFDINDLAVNQEYKATLTIPGIQDTPYSLGKVEITMLYLPWREFDKDDSMCLYTDASVAPLYGGSATQYRVKMQQHPTIDGIYRLVNPYGENWPYFGQFDYDDSEDHYLVIDARNPAQVLIEECATGVIDPDDGQMYILSYAYYVMQDGVSADIITSNKLWARLDDGIITFDPESSLVNQAMVSYFEADPTLYIGNKNNTFKIILPGYEDKPLWEDYGYCKFTDGLFGPWYGWLDNTYLVLVQHSLEDKSLYRIVNPYGVNSGYAEEEPESEEYMNINVADPDFVTFSEFEVFIQISQTEVFYSVLSMATLAMDHMGMSPAEAKASGYGGTYKDKVITLAGDNCTALFLNLTTNKLSYGFPDETCDLVLDLNNPIPVESEEPSPETQSRKIDAPKYKLGKRDMRVGALKFVK